MPSRAPGGRPAILVVDDENHVRSMIGATLERQGYDVQLASSGRELLRFSSATPSTWY